MLSGAPPFAAPPGSQIQEDQWNSKAPKREVPKFAFLGRFWDKLYRVSILGHVSRTGEFCTTPYLKMNTSHQQHISRNDSSEPPPLCLRGVQLSWGRFGAYLAPSPSRSLPRRDPVKLVPTSRREM